MIVLPPIFSGKAQDQQTSVIGFMNLPGHWFGTAPTEEETKNAAHHNNTVNASVKRKMRRLLGRPEWLWIT